jgi:F0F1-type ATP synthase assembly protein I
MWEGDESTEGESDADVSSAKSGTKGAGSGKATSGDNRALTTALVLATQMGFSIACPMVIFIGGGAWLDNQLGWGPWLLLIGIIVGLASAAGLFYQIAKAPASRRQKSGLDGEGAPYKVEERRKPGMRDLGKPPSDKIDGNGH